MPFNEATFWIGLTVAGTGLYFLIEGETRRRLFSLALTALGLLAVSSRFMFTTTRTMPYDRRPGSGY
jgi:hypothetical protein